jgi:hypothetical protein
LGNDGCQASGQYIPFKATKAERIAADDPRPSVEERHHSYTQYRNKVVGAIDSLVRRRFMICDDTQDIVTRLLQAGLAAGVPAPSPNENSSTPNPVPACIRHMPPNYHYHHVYDQDG